MGEPFEALPEPPGSSQALVEERTTKECYGVMRPPGVRGVRKSLADKNVTLGGSALSLTSASYFCYLGHLDVTLFWLPPTL